MAGISELGKKLNAVNDELVKLEMNSIFTVEEEERQHLMAKLEAWKLTKQAFISELHPALLSEFSLAYDALDLLQRFINLNLDSRFETLATKVQNPDDQFHELTNTFTEEDPDSTDEESNGETEEKSDIKKRVLEKMAATSKALLGEIKQEFEDSTRKTLAQWLKETEVTFEWHKLFELRTRAVHAGIELSKLLVHFMFSLAGDEAKLQCLRSKIMSVAMVPKKRMVAEKFVAVMNATRFAVSKKPRGGGLVQLRVQGAVEEEEALNKVMVQFSDAILDLEFILCCANVPETRRMVAGARIRLEDALGQTLYIMQGLKLRISKHNNRSWKTLKAFIADVWNLERYYRR